jgi:anti-sigma B factor antagonist
MSGGSRPIRQSAVPGPWTVVVKLPAEVDFSNKSQVLATLAGAMASRPKVVVADGTGTGFCDCAAIHMLIAAHHETVAAGAQLRVVITGALVRRVLELTGADQILLVYPSLADAHADHPTRARGGPSASVAGYGVSGQLDRAAWRRRPWPWRAGPGTARSGALPGRGAGTGCPGRRCSGCAARSGCG